MLRVALTGGISSGKSAVALMLRELGAQVSQSDEVARGMMQPDQPLFNSIAAHFGPAVMQPDGLLDRSMLARMAFEGGRLEELNALVHPAVIAEQARWLDSVEQRDPYAVAAVESALVLETPHTPADGSEVPWRTRFDRVVVVSSDERLRQQRYLLRVGAADSQRGAEAANDFKRRLAVQWTDGEREALADYVLRNDGSLGDLRDRVAILYGSLKAEAMERQNEAM